MIRGDDDSARRLRADFGAVGRNRAQGAHERYQRTDYNQALDVSEAPVIFSHSAARALVDHPRNVPDSILARLPKNGGVVMVTFVPQFVSTEFKVWEDSADSERKALRTAVPDTVERHRQERARAAEAIQ